VIYALIKKISNHSWFLSIDRFIPRANFLQVRKLRGMQGQPKWKETPLSALVSFLGFLRAKWHFSSHFFLHRRRIELFCKNLTH